MTNQINRRILEFSINCILVWCLFGLSAIAVAQHPVPFINNPLVPDSVAPGGPAFTLTVNGAGFLSTSIVQWNGSPRPTQFVSEGSLKASIAASDIAQAGSAIITVVNSTPGGGRSGDAFLPVGTPATTLSFNRSELDAAGGNIRVITADFNRDGKLDLAAVEYGSSSVRIFLGNGAGGFQQSDLFGACNAHGLAYGDFNGDGIPDLVIADVGCADISVFLGNGDGTFTARGTFSTGCSGSHAPYSVALGDFNSDGKLDLATANELCNTTSVLLGNGDGTFGPPVQFATGEDSRQVIVGDFNEDGRLDLAVSSSGGGVSVLLGNGDGSFQPQTLYPLATNDNPDLIGVDLNGDGHLDLAVANIADSVTVLLGKGDGTFLKPTRFATGGNSASIVAADFNNDGKVDLATGNYYSSSISLLLGKGDGTFSNHLDFPAQYGARGLAAADFNGDGFTDLAVANQFVDSVSIFLQARGRAATTTKVASSRNPSMVDQPVTFTATVNSAQGTPPNGETITFKNGSATLGTAALSRGSAALTTSSLAVGTSNITASYPGDSGFAPSTSPALRQVVNSTTRYPTTAVLTSSLNPSNYGQKISFTATVMSAGAVAPTGQVGFRWADGSLGAAKLNANGVAVLTRSTINAGSYAMTAVYGGDANNLGSSSAAVNEVVQPAASAASITSSVNPSVVGQTVTFTATIASPTVTPSGPVTFSIGKTVLGSVQLSGGKAQFMTSSLPAGSDKVTVTFYGDSNIAQSTASVVQTVQ